MNQPMQPAPTQFSVLVKKAERKLYIYRIENGQRQLFKSYTIALGNNPTGHKLRQGDGATPEGDYYLTHKNPKSNYYLSLGVSYPNSRDAAAGLKAGLISKPSMTLSLPPFARKPNRRKIPNWAATFLFTAAARAAIGRWLCRAGKRRDQRIV